MNCAIERKSDGSVKAVNIGMNRSVDYDKIREEIKDRSGEFSLYAYANMLARPQLPGVINYNLAIVDKLSNNLEKIEKWSKQMNDEDLYKKIQQDLQVPKDQMKLLINAEGTSIADKLMSVVTNYGGTVIKISTVRSEPSYESPDEPTNYGDDDIDAAERAFYRGDEEYETRFRYDPVDNGVTFYSQLTVPGGTNYSENEIYTPDIIPTIKGHASFATKNGIGWFRSDQSISKADNTELYIKKSTGPDFDFMPIDDVTRSEYKGKTRRILELQSDLFQKGRNVDVLADLGVFYSNSTDFDKIERERAEAERKSNKNNFLQLLNKDNNWVTFFIKSIVQDSVRKGYEKVLFPSGDTASKVEGHSTLEEFKRQKENRIKELENERDNMSVWVVEKLDTGEQQKFKTQEEASIFKDTTKYGEWDGPFETHTSTRNIEGINNEINQLRSELDRVEAEGFAALRPVYNFYENTVSNILKKQFGKAISSYTDEYGNTWNELDIAKAKLEKVTNSPADFNVHILASFEPSVSVASKNLNYTENRRKEDNWEKKFFQEGDRTSVHDVLQNINKTGRTYNKKIAGKLISALNQPGLSNINTTGVQLLSPEDFESRFGKGIGGIAVGIDTTGIYIKKGTNNNGDLLMLHEIIHVITMSAIDSGSPAARKFHNFYELAKERLIDAGMDPNTYELSNVHEFLTGLMTSPRFAAQMKLLPPIRPTSLITNLWQEFINILASLFNWKDEISLLEDAFDIALNTIEAIAREESIKNVGGVSEQLGMEGIEDSPYATMQEPVEDMMATERNMASRMLGSPEGDDNGKEIPPAGSNNYISITESEYKNIQSPQTLTLESSPKMQVFNKYQDGIFYRMEEYTEPFTGEKYYKYFKSEIADTVAFKDTVNPKQERILKLLDSTKEISRPSRWVSSDEVLDLKGSNKRIKAMAQVRDGLVRNFYYDEQTNKEVMVGQRPSDSGQKFFSRTFEYNKKKIAERNNTRESIIFRGMGTTLHHIMELFIMEIDRQNTLDPETGKFRIVSPDMRIGDHATIFNQNKKSFFDAIGSSGDDSSSEIRDILKEIGEKGKYIHHIPDEQLLDPGSAAEISDEDKKFTIDSQDFQSLAELAFRMYTHVYKTQGEIAWNRQVKGRPQIRVEAPVLDKNADVMGSIDMFVVYDNGQVGHYDYKFMNFEVNKEVKNIEGLSDAEVARQKAGFYLNNGEMKPNRTNRGNIVIDYKVKRKISKKQDAYNAQMTQYKNILTNAYGIERADIIQSMIVPVGMILQTEREDYEYTDTDGNLKKGYRFKLKPQLQYLEYMDETMRMIPVAEQQTGDKNLDMFVEKLMSEASVIRRKLKVDKGNQSLENALDNIENNIKLLQTQKDVLSVATNLVAFSKQLMENISQRARSLATDSNGDPFVDEFNEPIYNYNTKYMEFKDLVHSKHILQIYQSLRESSRTQLLKLEAIDPEKAKLANESIDLQNNLTSDLLNMLDLEIDSRILEAADQASFVKDISLFRELDINGRVSVSKRQMEMAGLGSDSRLSSFGDIGQIGEMFNALSDINHPHLRVLKGILDDIHANTIEYIRSLESKLEKVTQGLKDYGNTRGITGVKVFEFIVDPETKEVYYKYDQSLKDKLKQAREQNDTSWLQDNLEFDREAYDKEYSRRESYYERIYKGNTEQVNDEMRKFQEEFEMSPTNLVAWRNKRNKFFKPRNEEKWISKEWQNIQDTPALKAYYDVYREIINDIRGFTGYAARIDDQFVPNIQKDVIDTIAENGFSFGTLTGMTNILKTMNDVKQNDDAAGVTVEDKDVDLVPLPFFDGVPGGVKNKSMDVTRSLLVGALSARLYAEKTASEGFILALRDSLSRTKIMSANILGKRNPNKFIDANESHLISTMDKMIAYYIYGRKMQGKRQSEEAKKFTKTIDNLRSFHTTLNLSMNFFSATAGHIGAKSQALQLGMANRYFSAKDLMKARKQRFKMSRNEVLLDEYFDLSAEGLERITWENANKMSVSKLRSKYNKDMALILQRRSDDAIDRDILYAMMYNYVLHPNGVDVYNKKEVWRLKGTEWEGKELKPLIDCLVIKEEPKEGEMPFTLTLGTGEGEITKEQYIRFRNKVKYVANTVKGNYNKDDIAAYKTNTIINTLMHYKGWIPAMFLERWRNDKYNHTMEELERGRYRVAIGEIVGNSLIPKLKSFANLLLRLGGDVLTFSKFGLLTPNLVAARESFSKWIAENPGDYQALLDKYAVLNSEEDPKAAETAAFNEWVDISKKQLQTLASEVRAYLTAVTALLAFGFVAGDDETEDNPVVQKITKLLNRVSLEIGFFMSPTETYQVVSRNPVPMIGMVQTALKWLENTIEEGIDTAFGAEDNKTIDFFDPGDSPFSMDTFTEKSDKYGKLHYTFKFLPFANGLNNLFDITESGKENQTFLEQVGDWVGSGYYK